MTSMRSVTVLATAPALEGTADEEAFDDPPYEKKSMHSLKSAAVPSSIKSLSSSRSTREGTLASSSSYSVQWVGLTSESKGSRSESESVGELSSGVSALSFSLAESKADPTLLARTSLSNYRRR